MKANENNIIVTEEKIVATIGNTQVTQTPDGVTFTRLDSGEYLVVPGSGIPTIKSPSDCAPHFGALASGEISAVDHLIIDGEISDGYHTFNELYEHRTALFAMICRLFPELSWRSCLHSDGTMFDGMFIAGIRTPDGDYSYHCENKYWPMFDQVPELTRAPEWDGHQPKDFPRLFSLLSIDDVEPDDVDWSRLAWNEGDE